MPPRQIFGGATHVSLDGDLMETLASVVGAIVVLVAGSIWRKSKSHPEAAAAAAGSHGVDLP